MEILFILSIFCLVVFMVLATYDGAYLHLWKFELFNHAGSRFEHLTHTIRAVLFPIIVWLVFIDTTPIGFFVGVALIVLDLLILGIDAHSEKESRAYMGGLPRWEYIIHLFANSFHFSAFILMVATRLTISESAIVYSNGFQQHSFFETVQFVAMNILPGAIILGIIHVLLASRMGQSFYNSIRFQIKCC